MPEIVACPQCERKLRVPDEFIGKKVKCPQCNNTFTAAVAGAGGGGAGGGEKKEKKSEESNEPRGSLMDRALERNRSRSRSNEDEEDDRPRSRRDRDEDDEDDRPRSRRGRDADEDDDDRPRSRRGGRDYDDEDDDRPSRRGGRGRDDYDDDDDDRDRGRGKPTPKQEKAGWKNVSFGLFLIIISIWIYIGTMVGYFIGSFGLPYVMTSMGSLQGAMTIFTVFFGVVQFLFLAAFLCNIVGHGFTLYTPGHPRWSTRALGISSFSCLAFATLAVLMAYAYILVTFGIAAANPMAFAPGPRGMGGAGMMVQGMGLMVMLMLAGSLAYLAGSIVFMFYLNNLCLRINQHALAKTVIMCFIANVAYVVIYFLMSCLMGIIAGGVMADVRNANQAAATGTTMVYVLGAFGCVMGLIGLAIFIWYVVILYQVRGALDSYVRRKL